MWFRALLSAIALLFIGGRAAAYDVIAVAVPGMADSLRAVVAAPASPAPEGGWPSLYMLNGYDGSHLDWAKRVNVDSIASARGLVLVFPDGGNSWYFDTPGCPMETAITGPLIATVDSLYHTSSLPSRRAVAGLSMGGHGAIRLAGRHPELFATVASMSGAVDLATNPAMHKRYALRSLLGPYEAAPQQWRDASAVAQVANLSRNGTKVWLSCGESDFFYPDNERFARELRRAGVEVTFRTLPGTHNWKFWRAEFPQLLDFVSQSVR
ncbi:MAG: alpha/beta hydrolase-fold protein [Candidatus Amulumruptor caecigallinarius]|nr:alpha/beta hydrolase-fold protein [Candidatus Amulumruptor caecigallinarius]MCM1396392.1 alpha/beta hydrolase-fold protein [Candidatus Amulumruptor caecigallinarius]MCM1453551.1 alpha/beta hydrolase-fold protein [bacterium]